MNEFKTKNQEIFKSFDCPIFYIRWFDKEGILEKGECYVSFKIDDVGTRGDFNGYHVDIYSRKRGLLKSKFFRFNDYLPINHLWKNTDGTIDWFPVINSKRVEIPTEKEIEKYVDEIKKYINVIVN